ncbi:MAG: ribose 5-phosphate isomerase B [Deltaproteobacteria bacterium]|nr:ribose 5-phosphate isomerase B [Deltaproteobacteria bacterium]
MKVLIASDHAGLGLKNSIREFLENEKIAVEDLGPQSTDSVDYPDFASLVAQAIADKKADRGILVCGTGLGMIISANKFRGVRAVAVSDLFSARMSREHNDANLLALGARVLDPSKALRLVKTWLKTPFKGGRHQNRLDKISEIEKRNMK